MQTRRRLFAVLAALTIVTALIGGCSSSAKSSNKALPDATTLLKQSSQSTKNVKSVHLVLSVTGKVKGLPVKTLTGDLTTAPSTAAKGNATLILGDSDINAQFVVYDTVLYAALTPNKWSDFGPAADVYDVSKILDPNTGLANVLDNFTNAKAEGRETVNGQTTIRVSGRVPADAVNQLAPLNATQPQPATAWIQENGDHELVQAQLDQGGGSVIQMTLSNWGEQVQVSKPPVSG
jgi:lipoprotein LprG